MRHLEALCIRHVVEHKNGIRRGLDEFVQSLLYDHVDEPVALRAGSQYSDGVQVEFYNGNDWLALELRTVPLAYRRLLPRATSDRLFKRVAWVTNTSRWSPTANTVCDACTPPALETVGVGIEMAVDHHTGCQLVIDNQMCVFIYGDDVWQEIEPEVPPRMPYRHFHPRKVP